ncbi:MAG TPA: S8 family serine peptidase [Thermoanaerobaculia bacterium]|nr:S8 family serine peptidase [Thermoanaerobaculia bacterium]
MKFLDGRHRLVVLIVIIGLALAGQAQDDQMTPGLSRLLAASNLSLSARGIATFDAIPTATQVRALQALGLAVQPMSRVPLANVVGPLSAMQAAVANGIATDVYPDERIQLLDTASSDAMGAAATRLSGLTGKGVTVAIVDSGCDATHPDLAKRVVHNVKLYSGEYANVRADGSNTIVVPVEMLPRQDSDIGGGHGTHVAGIIAADGTSGPMNKGVAPEASLVCYSIGEVLFTTAVVTAYDHMLAQPGLWSIDVVNNSWGNSYKQFDPRDPVAVVTKAVADLGVTVVFAAGNSGDGEAAMSLNPFSEAPWVISVAAESLSHVRGDFSSNGLVFDNSEARTVGAGGYTTFTGDRIGIYHPDVTAPGVSISSSCAMFGVAIGPCPLYGNEVASGTSMASPHVAGAAAVLLQANPQLTPAQVRSAMQATAQPVKRFGSTSEVAPFWQTGYGRVDLAAAANLVRSKNFAKDIANAQTQADNRVLNADGFKVRRSDFWTWDAPRVAINGIGDQRSFTIGGIGAPATHLSVSLSHPSDTVVGRNDAMTYEVVVRDANGREIGRTTEAATGAGTASVLIDLAAAGAAPGTFTFEVTGQLSVSDPDTLDSASLLGDMVTLQIAQVQR